MSTFPIEISDYVPAWGSSPFLALRVPWEASQNAEGIISKAIRRLGDQYIVRTDAVLVHVSAVIEAGAVEKGPAIIGPGSFVASGAYLRGGCFLAEDCIVGPSAELKTSFMFPGSKPAHLNFVGDSILGSGVNIEAGAMVANHRNELEDKVIKIRSADEVITTGVTKFGALLGDGARMGANAASAPGALLKPHAQVGRVQLTDRTPL